MNQDLLTWLASDNGLAVHLGVMISLLLGGLGFPIPEDIPIALAGVAAAKSIVSFKAIFTTCYFGVVIADQLVYFIGYLFGNKLLSAGTNSRFLPGITLRRVRKAKLSLRRRKFLYIFLGRHLFPLRTVTFLTAGALRIPYLEFFVADSIAAFFSVFLVIWIGFWLGENLTPEVLGHFVNEAHYYLTAFCVIIVLIVVFQRVWKQKRKTDNELDSQLVEEV